MTTTMPELPEHASCRTCGYALQGLTEPRCPECGSAFNPADARTFRLPPKPRFRITITSAARAIARWGVQAYTEYKKYGTQTLTLTLLLASLTAAERRRGPFNGSPVFFYIPILWFVVLPRLLIATVSPRGREGPPFWKTITAITLFFLAAMPIYPWSRHCQHGDVWMLGRLGVSHSPFASPCPVTMPYRVAIPVGGEWYFVINPEERVAGRWR